MTAIDTDVNAVKRMFEVNVFGPMRMVHHFHDMLIRATGTIVNIGSIGGVVPYMYGGMMSLSNCCVEDMLMRLKLHITRPRPLFTIILTPFALRCHHSSEVITHKKEAKNERRMLTLFCLVQR